MRKIQLEPERLFRNTTVAMRRLVVARINEDFGGCLRGIGAQFTVKEIVAAIVAALGGVSAKGPALGLDGVAADAERDGGCAGIPDKGEGRPAAFMGALYDLNLVGSDSRSVPVIMNAIMESGLEPPADFTRLTVRDMAAWAYGTLPADAWRRVLAFSSVVLTARSEWVTVPVGGADRGLPPGTDAIALASLVKGVCDFNRTRKCCGDHAMCEYFHRADTGCDCYFLKLNDHAVNEVLWMGGDVFEEHVVNGVFDIAFVYDRSRGEVGVLSGGDASYRKCLCDIWARECMGRDITAREHVRYDIQRLVDGGIVSLIESAAERGLTCKVEGVGLTIGAGAVERITHSCKRGLSIERLVEDLRKTGRNVRELTVDFVKILLESKGLDGIVHRIPLRISSVTCNLRGLSDSDQLIARRFLEEGGLVDVGA